MDREYMRKKLESSMPREIIRYVDPGLGRSYIIVECVLNGNIYGNFIPFGEEPLSIDRLLEMNPEVPIGWKSESQGNETS